MDNHDIPDEILNSPIFKFKLEIGGKQFTVDSMADVNIDYDLIQLQLEQIPSNFVYWAMIYSELKSQCTILEIKIKARKGILVKELISQAAIDNRRITDKQINSLIESDEKLKRLEAQSIILQKNTGKIYMVVEALRIKSESLRSLAGFARQELRNA